MYSQPSFLFAVTTGGIVLVEATIMLVLPLLPTMSTYQEAAVDACSLAVVIFPLLYVLVFRPMRDVIDRYRQALSEVKTLRGIIPICSECGRVRDDSGTWQAVETYVHSRSDAEFSHGLCHDCLRSLYPDDADRIIAEMHAPDEK